MSAICRSLGAATYLADSGACNYLQPTDFTSIEVLWQNWREPTEKWPGITSWRDIASVNYLSRVGPERFTEHLLKGEFVPDPTWNPFAPAPSLSLT